MPPGWTYCPSTYLQRLPIVVLGAVGFVIARVLAVYQLGHVEGVWEPFFQDQGGENGTEFIITSDVSKAWPIADGGLGATTYMFEILMGVTGGRSRWRTMPWMVLLFGKRLANVQPSCVRQRAADGGQRPSGRRGGHHCRGNGHGRSSAAATLHQRCFRSLAHRPGCSRRGYLCRGP